MRISCVLGPYLPVPPVRGGAVERVWQSLTLQFARMGHDVTMISRCFADFPNSEHVDGVHHLRIPSTDAPRSRLLYRLFDVVYAARVAAMLPASDVTITNSVALPLFLPRGRSGKIYVSVARFPKGQMALYARANRLQAVSRAVADAIKVQSPSMYERVRVLPNTLSETFSNLPAEAHGERKREILYIGRIAREKGLHLLIRAFHLIADPDDWTLTLLGPYEAAAGGDGDEYLDELRRICPARSGNIRFEEPIYDEHRLAQRLKSAAIFVYPSIAERGESFGMAPLEAMACGCAVLVSALECFRDFIVEGENALTFDHRDATGTTLAHSLERLIADSTLRTRLGAKAIQTAMSFRSANVAPLFISDFSELLLQNAPQ